MSQIPEYYAQVLQTLANDLKHTLQPNNDEDVQLVRKGFLLFRQGRVSKIKVDREATTAIVEDVAAVQVELNHTILPLSTCLCPSEGICRHQVAVFFQVYSRIESVSLWIDQWKALSRLNHLDNQWGLVRAKDALKSSQTLNLDYNQWIADFESTFQSIVMGNVKGKPYVVEHLFEMYVGKMKRSAPRKQGWKELYELVLYIHGAKQLMRVGEVFPFSKATIEENYLHLFYNLSENVKEVVKKLTVHALPFEFDSYMERLMDDVRRIVVMDDEKVIYERFLLYFILWSRFFVKKSWHEKEEEKLKEWMNEKRTLPLFFAFIHQQVMLKRDDVAFELLKTAGVHGMVYLKDWLSFLLEKREYKRMDGYIEVFLSSLNLFVKEKKSLKEKEAFLEDIFQMLRKHGEETGNFHWLESAYILTLPDSFHWYREFLLTNQRYEMWCDLYLFMGEDIDGISKEDIRYLKENAPHVLLPLYHQAIEKHISIKNRANYRIAAVYLKEVRAIYEKRQKMELWEEFFQYLLHKYRRLPAFYEECKRVSPPLH